MAGKDKITVVEPIHPSAVDERPDCPKATNQLEGSTGFKYRSAMRKHIFAYMTCHLEIGTHWHIC
jgi:hypothetical protein